jgi:toxin-antitoxin system PIN domain toxin
MSIAIDENILLYASDSTSRFHARAIDFVRACIAGPELVFLPWPVAMAYLRISTHPSVFARPLSHAEAIGNLEALLSLPHVRTLGEAEGFWQSYLSVTEGLPVRGNLVPDAHLVALLLQHGVTEIASHDRDLQRFAGIRLRDPLA